MDAAFSGLALIIAIGAGVALIMRLIGQPLLIGYIITGILVGPAMLHVAKSAETLTLFSDIGIALLLFIIGLGLNPRAIREVTRTASYVAVTQVAIITILGVIVGRALGLTGNESLFLGSALAISSTVIILKLLSDKREQARLYGKIAISTSLVQDLIAIILVVITSSATASHRVSIGSLFTLTIKALVVGWLIYLVSYQVLMKFRNIISGSQEFLFLFAIAWGLGSAALFAKIGLSFEIGALLAGICMAPVSYSQEVGARLRPLRDFFLIVFFIALGSNLSFSHLGSMLAVILLSLVIVIVIKPLVAMGVLGFLGYTKRTSFKAAIPLAQVSEFSIVLIILGQSKGLINENFVSALILITLLAIAASTYMVGSSDKLFKKLEPYLNLFERKGAHGEPNLREANDLILFGYQKGGHEFIKVFKKLRMKFVVIDYDPEVIDTLENRGINYLYGDATDVELLEEAGADKAKLIVSTITDFETSQALLDFIKKHNSEALVICEAESPKQAARLYRKGASYVILPHHLGSEKIGSFLQKTGLHKSTFKRAREQHLRYLENEFGALEETKKDRDLGSTIVKNMASLTRVKRA